MITVPSTTMIGATSAVPVILPANYDTAQHWESASPVPSTIPVHVTDVQTVQQVPVSDLGSRVAKLEAVVAQNQSWIGHLHWLQKSSRTLEDLLNGLDMRIHYCENSAHEQQARYTHLMDEYQGRSNKLITELETSLGSKVFAKCLEIEGRIGGMETRYNEMAAVIDKNARGLNGHFAKCMEVESAVQGLKGHFDSKCNELRDSVDATMVSKTTTKLAEIDGKLESLRVQIENKLNSRWSDFEKKFESHRTTWDGAMEALRPQLQSTANVRCSETEMKLGVQIENLQRLLESCQRCSDNAKSELSAMFEITIGSKVNSKCSEIENKLSAMLDGAIVPKVNSRCSEVESKVSVKLDTAQQQCDLFQRQCEARISDHIQTLRDSKAEKQELERYYNQNEHLIRQSECRIDEQMRVLRESKADKQDIERCLGLEKKWHDLSHSFNQAIFDTSSSFTSSLSKQGSELKASIASVESAYKGHEQKVAEALRLKAAEFNQLVESKADKPVISSIESKLNDLKAQTVYRQEIAGLNEAIRSSYDAHGELSKLALLASRVDRIESLMSLPRDTAQGSIVRVHQPVVHVRPTTPAIEEDTMTRLRRELGIIERRGNVQVNWDSGQVTLWRKLEFDFRSANDSPTAVFCDVPLARAICKDLADITNLLGVSVIIEGHTSGTSTDSEFWRVLANNRALAVKELMVSHGANPSLIQTQGMPGQLGKNEAAVQVRINIRDNSNLIPSLGTEPCLPTTYAPLVLGGSLGASSLASSTSPRMITYSPVAPTLPKLAGPKSPKTGYDKMSQAALG